MGYATVADIERYNPARAPFSAQTKPSATQVIGLIGDAQAEVETVLTQNGYAVPIPTTATVAYALTIAAVAQRAAYLVEQVAPTSNREQQYKTMSDQAMKMLLAAELPSLDKDGSSLPRGPGNAPTAMVRLDMDL